MTNVATRQAKEKELIEEAFNRINHQMNAEQIKAQLKNSLVLVREQRKAILTKLVSVAKSLSSSPVKDTLPANELESMQNYIDFEIDRLKSSFKDITVLKKYPNIRPLFTEYDNLSSLNIKPFAQKELRAIYLAINYAEMRKEEFTNINLSEMKEIISNQMSEASTLFVLNKLNKVD